MRLWPHSLRGQLSLLLIAAVVIAQLAAFTVLTAGKTDVHHGAVRTHAVNSLVMLVRTLAVVPAASAPKVIEAFDTRRHRFWLSAHSAISGNAGDDGGARLERKIARRLKGTATEPRVALVERQPGQTARRLRRPQALHISVRLPDGRWLNESAPFRLPSGRRELELLLASVVAILVSVMLAVRRITRPVTTLADAAERFGRGESIPALVPRGAAELRRMTVSFDIMQQRISRFVEDRMQIVAAISHDLRTPITALRLRAELIDDEELREAIIRTLADMQQMTEATLAFVRDETIEEETRTVDLVALLDVVAEDFIVAGYDVAIAAPKSLPFRCRPTALRRALANLVENAIRYGKRARVTLAESDDGVRIIIEDEGPGVPADRLNDIFRPFVRVEASRSPTTGGIGLGLTIVRSVVAAHGGTIKLANGAEGGLRARIELPSSRKAELALTSASTA